MDDCQQYNKKFYIEPDSVLMAENSWFERIIRELKVADLKCLDFGCGPGSWIKLYLEEGAIVTGFDISPDVIKHCQCLFPACEFFLPKDKKIPFLGGVFDIVIAAWVIQEIYDHNDFKNYIIEIARVLKDHGRFIVVNNIYPDNRILLETTNWGDIFSNTEEENLPMLRFFHGNSMEKIMKQFGFQRYDHSSIGWSFCEVYRKKI